MSITGKDSWGWSLYIYLNDALASLDGLARLRGALPGGLWV